MGPFKYKGKSYEVDSNYFLADYNSWDKGFAKGMAQRLGMAEGLRKEQWDVIKFLRESYKETGICPNVYETCRICNLRVNELWTLFPHGFLRGACKLAGISYREGFVGQYKTTWPPYKGRTAEDMCDDKVHLVDKCGDKIYLVDVRGFLVNPDGWDEYYAIHRAYDMKIPGGKLTDKHWQIIRFLRESYDQDKVVPTIYETCGKNNINLEELEQLFPDGYHRGAVKIAGLRVR